MRNQKFLPGMLVIVLAFGMAVAGCDDGSKDDGGNGIFKLTGIPSQYNGKYGALFSDSPIFGAESVKADGTAKLVAIKDGSVNLPMWTIKNGSVVGYTGNDTFFVSFEIYASADYDVVPDDPVDFNGALRYFKITFKNGSASEKYGVGVDDPELLGCIDGGASSSDNGAGSSDNGAGSSDNGAGNN